MSKVCVDKDLGEDRKGFLHLLARLSLRWTVGWLLTGCLCKQKAGTLLCKSLVVTIVLCLRLHV